MSTMKSASRIVSSSCSTTINVLPRSRSVLSVASKRALSRWCNPMDGSSSTYKNADERRADLRREPDALRFAAGKRGRAAVQRQIFQPDVDEKTKPRAQLFDDLARDLLLARRSASSRVDESEGAIHGERGQLRDGKAADGHRQRFRLEPRALARRTADRAS